MCEPRWVGTKCYRCGLPIQKNDAQEYDIAMMPIHREDYCVSYLKNELEEMEKYTTRLRGASSQTQNLDYTIRLEKEIMRLDELFNELETAYENRERIATQEGVFAWQKHIRDVFSRRRKRA